MDKLLHAVLGTVACTEDMENLAKNLAAEQARGSSSIRANNDLERGDGAQEVMHASF